MIVQNKIEELLRDNLNISKLIIENESNKPVSYTHLTLPTNREV